MSVRGRVNGINVNAALHGEPMLAAIPGHWGAFQQALSRKASDQGCAACQYATSMRSQFRMASIALAAKGGMAELPEELLGQVIKDVVMHEVGHSLGLRHNFRASTMLDQDELHDTSITRKKGLIGSVMDYAPVNIARKGEKQGDYATTTIGPYDYWAIEYAYKPISGNEKEELKKIAARSPEPGLDFATDEDLYDSFDPRVNVYDLGSNSLEFAKHRIALAGDVLEDMDDKLVKASPSSNSTAMPPTSPCATWAAGTSHATHGARRPRTPSNRSPATRPARRWSSSPRTSSSTTRCRCGPPCSAASPASTGCTGAPTAASRSRKSPFRTMPMCRRSRTSRCPKCSATARGSA
jgi:hypothetical protein